MSDFLEFFLPIFAMIAIMILSAVGLVWANEAWNCSQPIGRPTRVMAATCYVQAENGKWVTFNSYIKQVNVDLTAN